MKKIKYVLPYIAMPILTPFYNLLDRFVIVEVFGCGCVPSAQTNMLNIAFNANDFRFVFYFALTVVMTIVGVKMSKDLSKKALRILYGISVLTVNSLLCMEICKAFMWN